MGQMAAAGGAIGTAITPGVGTAIGTIVGGLLDGPMVGSSGATGPAGPSSAAAAVYGSGLDSANWFVNFGGTQTATGSADKPLSATGPTASTAASGGGGGGGGALPWQQMPGSIGGAVSGISQSLGLGNMPVWAWAVVGGLVLWKLKSKK